MLTLKADRIREQADIWVPNNQLTLRVEPSVTSTNDLLLAEMTPHGLAIFAEQQTLGRGRRGGKWVSPPGGNIYLSFGWEIEASSGGLTALPLALAVEVSEAIAAVTKIEISLKWPNDLYLNGAKCGGLLIDILDTKPHSTTAVVGLGINVIGNTTEVSSVLGHPIEVLADRLPENFNINVLAGDILGRMVRCCQNFNKFTFFHWAPRWRKRDLLIGKIVSVKTNEPITGRVTGIDEKGMLLVDLGNEIICLAAGEVTIGNQKEIP